MIKRYYFDFSEGYTESPQGDWCKYEDAANLQSERDALAAEVEGLRAVIEDIAQQWDGCQYESVACDIDIGEAIRSAAQRLIAARTTGGQGHE